MNGYHLNQSSSAVLSSSTVNITQFVTVVVTFVPVDEILWCDHSITTGTSSSNWYSCMVLLLVACSTMYMYYVVLTFESVDGIHWYYHSNETFSAVQCTLA